MRGYNCAVFRLPIVFFVVLVTVSSLHAQSWQPLKNQPSFEASTAMQLTDGTILVHQYGGANWYRLTPDANGNYVKGTWKQLASLPAGYAPLYYASAVLPDGRVIVEGGEYNNFQAVWTNKGAIYDPLTDKWKSVNPPPGWNSVGDAENVVLPDGTFMLANCCSTQAALLDSANLTWSPTGGGKADSNNEEGWTLLQDGSVLTVDANNGLDPMHAEKYIPTLGQWISAGNTGVLLTDPGSHEIGPAVLMNDGTVFATGGTGHTSIYHPPAKRKKPGKWIPGPDFPKVGGRQLDIADGPCSILTNGNVLCGASPGIFEADTHFFEFDGVSLAEVPRTPNSPNISSFEGRMLVLPTGQILYTDGTQDVEIYNSAGNPDPSWAPVITDAPNTVSPGQSYKISGKQLNGLTQGSQYGDDAASATNYPLVRITNHATGHVFYARTKKFGSHAVATGDKVLSAKFIVADRTETGSSDLEVVANGIASDPVVVNVQ
jgi:hypothetical protein